MRADSFFAVVPEWVLYHPDVSDGALRLYCVLRRHADEGGEAWPSQARLAKLVRKSDRQVRNLLKELEAAGAVRIAPRFNREQGQQSNRYTVIANDPRKDDSLPLEVDNRNPPEADFRQNQSHKNQSHSLVQEIFEALYREWIGKPYEKGAKLTKSEAGKINAASRELATMEVTPAEVAAKAAAYREQWPGITLTPHALVNNWTTLEVAGLEAHKHTWVLIDDTGTAVVYRCEGCGVTTTVGS